MKKKLPSYTLEEALKLVNPSHPYYTLERVKKMFPGKKRITAKDVLKVPARKFPHGCHAASPGVTKCYAVCPLMPDMAKFLWANWVNDEKNKEGSSSDIKYGLKLCDRYEKGEI